MHTFLVLHVSLSLVMVIILNRVPSLLFMHTFLALHVSLSLVMVMLLKRVPTLLCFYITTRIKFCFNSLYLKLILWSLYPDVFTTHLLLDIY